MTAIRVLLGYANAKVSLVQVGQDGVKVESKGQDSGRSQLLIAENLKEWQRYNLIFEFSERQTDLDGEGALGCEVFTLAFKTWDSASTCQDGIDKTYGMQEGNAMRVSPGDSTQPTTIRMSKGSKR